MHTAPLVPLAVVSLIHFASVFRPIHLLQLFWLECSPAVLSQTSSFALGFEKADDIVLSHCKIRMLATSSDGPGEKDMPGPLMLRIIDRV
jgi:hypothetical protein